MKIRTGAGSGIARPARAAAAVWFLAGLMVGIGTLAASGAHAQENTARGVPTRDGVARDGGSPLPIPPIIEGPVLNLNVQTGRLDLPFGTSDTLGYNGDYLGPTIRVRNGDAVDIRVENTLREDTTVHWHGLHVPAEFDGGPRQVIPAGSSWNPRFSIDQNAATLWYHPHLMGKTANQVYRGLAGFFFIEDAYSDSLSIPREYGVNDIPVVLQDRRIKRNGTFDYSPARPDVMHGYIGSAMLANGAIEPVLSVKQGTYRFRVLNGSNSSIFRVSLSDRTPFTVIASDGGFLPESVEMDAIVMVPGERFELLVDFDAPGDHSLVVEIDGGETFDAMHISVNGGVGTFYDHPEAFRPFTLDADLDVASLDRANLGSANAARANLTERTFRMEVQGMGRLSINGRTMDLSRIDFSVPGNTTEIWTIENVGMGMMRLPHSFHVHDVQFMVLSVNGQPPHPVYRGPKDTVPVMPGQRVEIALRFTDYSGVYMYHCHFLEHEDAGMMGQFVVEPST